MGRLERPQRLVADDKSSDDSQDADVAMIIISKRGFGMVRPTGDRAYATVEQVHASLAAIAKTERRTSFAALQEGTSFAALQEAVLQHAGALAEVTEKLQTGELDEAEAARRSMKLLGAPLHHAIDMALNKEQAQTKLARARRDSLGKRKSIP